MKLDFKPLGFLVFLCLFAAGYLLPSCSVYAAEAPPAGAPPGSGTDNVARLLFEADVYFNLDEAKRALSIYAKADPPGTCNPILAAAYAATQGGAERLYLDMEAARKGDMAALRSALDRLYLTRTDPYADPQIALELYERAKQANPKGTIEDEGDIAELLRMATAPGPFDIGAFLKERVGPDADSRQTEEGGQKPYFLWELAEEASREGSFGKPDPEVVLQLVARGTGELPERLSGVRTAFANWSTKRPVPFNCVDHLSSQQGVRYALRRMLRNWEQDQKGRAAALLARASSKQCEPLLKQALESAERLAQLKSEHLHFTDQYGREWQSALFLRWDFEKSLRLMESVFTGIKPVVPDPPARGGETFQKWRVAAENEVPPHLLEQGLGDHAGPCLAFSETQALKGVVTLSEAKADRFAEVFAQLNPALSLEEWKSWLLTEILRDLDGSVPVLERWSPTQATARVDGEQSAGVPGARREVKGKDKGKKKRIEKDLAALRSGLNAEQSVLFDSMKLAAFAWIERHAALLQGGDAGGAPKDSADADQQKWLSQFEPLLAGCIPSRVVPGGLAEAVLNVQARMSMGLSPASLENREAETAAWLEYQRRAGQFLATLSPALSEEDWRGWFFEERAWKLPSSALAYTAEERESSIDERYSRKLSAFETDFKRREAVFKDPRSMELDFRQMEIPGIACSDDGRLRILSWDTETGGTAHNYCVMSQFKSPDGQVGYAVLQNSDGSDDDRTADTRVGVAGAVGQKIETIVTKSQGTVYLLWWTARTSTRFWAEGVTAVRLHNGRIESVPFFKTKKALLSSIQFGYGIDSDAEFRFVKTPEYTLLVPIISDEYRFSGKFFKYVFDGSKFVFSGVQ